MKGFYWLSPILIVSAAACLAPGQETAALLSELSEARTKLDSQLVSGHAVGVLGKTLLQGDANSEERHEIQVYYDDPKYRVHITRLADAPSAGNQGVQSPGFLPSGGLANVNTAVAVDESIVIFDGESVFLVQQGNVQQANHLGHKTVWGHIYFDFKQQAVLRKAGYPFNPPLHLWASILKPGQLPVHETSLQPLAGGGQVLHVQHAEFISRYYLFDQFPFDFRRVALTTRGSTKPFRETAFYWESEDGVHFLRRYASKERSTESARAGRPSVITTRGLELEFSNFRPNIAIDPAVFTLDDLHLPPGTSFEDHRQNVGGKFKVLVWDGAKLK